MSKQRFLNNAYYEKRSSEEVLQFYEDWAGVYDEELTENDYRQPVRCAEALKALLPDTDASILDAGCGTGLSGLALAHLGYSNIDGCDFSPGMLKKAAKTDVYRKLFTADLNKTMACADDSYDAVAAVGVFSFGHIAPDAMDELLRITKAGGPIVMGFNDYYYQEGSLTAKLDRLAARGRLERLATEHGDHIRGTGLTGWVLTMRKI